MDNRKNFTNESVMKSLIKFATPMSSIFQILMCIIFLWYTKRMEPDKKL